MKKSIKVLFTATLIMQVLSLKAQSANGVYLNENDYKYHKLSYTSNTDKIQLNEFFGGSSIHITSGDKRISLAKNEIFGYRLANDDYRFYNHVAYKIIDTAGFNIYSREKLSLQTKGYKPTLQYFYSVDNKQAINELTITNLTASFPKSADFRYSLQSYFRNDADLMGYDKVTNQYKLKYLYFEHKRVMANNQ